MIGDKGADGPLFDDFFFGSVFRFWIQLCVVGLII